MHKKRRAEWGAGKGIIERWELVKSHLFSSIDTTYEKWNKFSASARLDEDLWWYGEHFLLKVRQVWLKWKESRMYRNILKSWKKVSFHSWPIIITIMQYSSKITLRFTQRSWRPNGSKTTILLLWVGLQSLLNWIPSKISGVY